MAIIKCCIADAFKIIRKRNLLQIPAKRKRLLPDACYRIRDSDFLQARAIIKCRVSDTRHSLVEFDDALIVDIGVADNIGIELIFLERPDNLTVRRLVIDFCQILRVRVRYSGGLDNLDTLQHLSRFILQIDEGRTLAAFVFSDGEED